MPIKLEILRIAMSLMDLMDYCNDQEFLLDVVTAVYNYDKQHLRSIKP